MKNIHSIEFYTGSKEELLPDFEKDFPYIASRAELDKYIGGYVPWHWHRTVELFYMESGSIEYDTPGGKLLFPAGSDIGKIFFKTGKQFFLASSIKFNAMDIFHVCSPTHPGFCIYFMD